MFDLIVIPLNSTYCRSVFLYYSFSKLEETLCTENCSFSLKGIVANIANFLFCVCTRINSSFHINEFLTIRVSVRLSDRSKVTQNKINFVKNCPQWGWNPGPPDHHSNAQPTDLGWNLLGRRFLKWALFHALRHMLDCSFLESIYSSGTNYFPSEPKMFHYKYLTNKTQVNQNNVLYFKFMFWRRRDLIDLFL